MHRRLSYLLTPLSAFSTKTTTTVASTLILEDSTERQAAMRTKVYCEGSLLETVQRARLFPDSKHFVDMPLKTDADVTLARWEALLSSGNLDIESLRRFIEEHFEEPGGELDTCQPDDFDETGVPYQNIDCAKYRAWALDLHRKWPSLCRKVSDRVLADPSRFSLIALPRPFVVPGGRFREMYYWDSFFTIKGLLASGMFDTARDIIENMGFLIEQFGFVPNGTRIYYLNRSQPPLLTWCVHAHWKATGDVELVKKALPWLEKEASFFTQRRSIAIEGCEYPLYRYHVLAAGPRPESYREDVECAEHIADVDGKLRLWGDIAAAAESGRDFSSRWFSLEGPQAGGMGSTRTSELVPVDLNAIICGNWKLISELYDVVDDLVNCKRAIKAHDAMKQAIHQVLWNEEAGCWFDFDLRRGAHVAVYMDTNFFPMYTHATHEQFDVGRVSSYLSSVGVLSFPGGLPSSLIASGQQWDFPNAWAPTTWIIIQGLRECGETNLAKKIASKWLRKNFNMWKASGGRMFEKYNVTACQGELAGGGEYEVQEGFGWTNGVVLDLLLTYAHELDSRDNEACTCCQPAPIVIHTQTVEMEMASGGMMLKEETVIVTEEEGRPVVIIEESETPALIISAETPSHNEVSSHN